MAVGSPPPEPKTQQLFSIKELCHLYGLDRRSVWERIKSGQFKAVRKPGSSTKANRIFIVDPGWQNVVLYDTAKHGKDFNVDDVHVLKGCEVAKILGIHTRTVSKMAEEGRLGFVKTGIHGRSHRRYSIADVRKAMATKEKSRCQVKRPSRKAVRDAVLRWARERLGINQGSDPTESSPKGPEAPH